MRKIIQFAVRLYPARWRARYGPEFDALLEDMNAGFRDLLDIVQEALLMQFNFSNVRLTAAVFGLLGIFVAVLVSIGAPRRYASTAMIGIQADRPDESRATWAVIAPHVFSDESLTRLIEQNGLYKSEFRSRPMANRLDRFKHDISVVCWTPQVWRVSFTYPNSQKAQKVTADLVQRFAIEENLYVAQRVAANKGLYIVSSPYQIPVGANLIEVLSIGLGGGVLLGAAFAVLRRRIQPSH